MTSEPGDIQSPEAADAPTAPPAIDPALHSLENEIRALRRALTRLEALAEHEEDPAALVRLAGAIARLSDSIVRALAAHHKLVEQFQAGKLAQEWAKLEQARLRQYEGEQRTLAQLRDTFRGQQKYWLEALAEAAHAAAAGDPVVAKQVAEGLDAYIRDDVFVHVPDHRELQRMRDEMFAAAFYSANSGSAPPT